MLAPIWVPALAGMLRFGMGFRIEGAASLRERFRALRRTDATPLLICPNHLTLIDSALVAWALGSPAFFLLDFAALPWNLPERRNFATQWWSRAGVWLLKCLPIERGGRRDRLSETLANAASLLAAGDVLLVFPEGRRSRTGRVEAEAGTWGVGRLVAAVPGCRVLCVYLRGEHQDAMGRIPQRGERFHVASSLIEPKSEASGVRRSLELSRQILAELARLETAQQGPA